MTRVFIGDIQGCFEELQRLLEKIDFSPSRMELCCVGDPLSRTGTNGEGLVYGESIVKPF